MQLRGTYRKQEFDDVLDDLGTLLDGPDDGDVPMGYIEQLTQEPKRVARRLAALAKEMRNAERSQLG